MDLTTAIRDGRLLSFTYDGLPRVVQPAAYGYTTAGNLAMRGCLVRGQSNRQRLPCWELYTVTKMLDAVVLEERFEDFALAGYRRGDAGLPWIIAER